jgi:hypothetical protein
MMPRRPRLRAIPPGAAGLSTRCERPPLLTARDTPLERRVVQKDARRTL